MANGICQLHELVITFADGRARRFVFGRPYDLDQEIAGVPLRTHLGPLVAKFTPEPAPVQQTQTVTTDTTPTPAKAKENR